ncbi:MAG: hypothetical protein ACR2PB_10235 [Desulfocapsaceae bacterium]
MRRTARSIAKLLFPLLLTVNFLIFSTGFCLSAETSDAASADVNAQEMMAGLTDEQARQLLIEELKKDIDEEGVGTQKMKGPAFILSRLLRVMNSQHDDSEDEVRALFSSLPTMGSDLYRVFVKL